MPREKFRLKYAISVNSGTSTSHSGGGLRRGGAGMRYSSRLPIIGSAGAIMHHQRHPFFDIDRRTFNIDAKDVEP